MATRGGGRVLSPIFGGSGQTRQRNDPSRSKICAYLARNLDADGGTSVIYWAVGTNGSQIEVVGDLSASQAEQHRFGPPERLWHGNATASCFEDFCERFKDAPWGFYVFITDGELHDLDEVMAFSKQLCQEIAARRRNPLKLVLIACGKDVDEYQMSELDDLDTGTDIDLWDHKLAADMRTLEQIFAEVVDRNARVADHGKIKTPDGKIVADFTDKGLPAYLEFTVPAEVMYFTLEVNGQQIHQTLDDAVPAAAVQHREGKPLRKSLTIYQLTMIPPNKNGRDYRWNLALGPAPKVIKTLTSKRRTEKCN
jgi:hypothetical protein